MWWLSQYDGRDAHPHPYAEGNFGQFLFLAPEHEIAIVRFGKSYGALGSSDWVALFEEVLASLTEG